MNYKGEPSIWIHSEPYACTDGSINPGSIIVQNYLTEHYLDRATEILEKHGLQRIANFREHNSDPYGDKETQGCIEISVHPGIMEKLKDALQDLREVSDGVEAVDLMRKKETGGKLEKEEEKFEKSVEAFKRIMEG